MIKARMIMHEKRISRAELSRATGISQGRVDLIVMGIDKPTTEELNLIAEALDYERDIEELFDDVRGLYDR